MDNSDNDRVSRGHFLNSPRPLAEKAGAVPRLEDLAVDPAKACALDVHATQSLTIKALAALNVLNCHQLELLWCEYQSFRGSGRERLLGVKEAAEKFGVKADWLYRHHKDFGFTVRHGRMLRFSEVGIEQHILKRRR